MSIYTDMIEILRERGLAIGTPIDEEGKCCLLGAKALAQGTSEVEINDTINVFNGDGIEELVAICSDRRNHNKAFNHNKQSYTYVWAYSDEFIQGNTDAAIALLEEAESLRQNKTVV
ncbi:hypothetical protein SEA_WEASELS2_137 [Rhodococcus phage Weasels2]|uniref:Uncharacterized protein n=1 Tax=Rhodococcus phage Weasels2 TaxID=1897437 RepID=A0A1I9SAB6_9CAUD|nr:hypothetical protein FDH04_gp272 [Rhodococcus phage Weasels2]AOZ63722.1 hypothetical protein SEA_WEASELS2_137 [Rhodococcus phage Weasels2]